jgi:superoxide dismutase, Fe-Mn family
MDGKNKMKYKSNNYAHLFGMKGFSTQLLENHFTLYQGYVDHTNGLLEALSGMDKSTKKAEYAELKRRLGWEFNGMRLHEYYFENLGGKNPLKNSLFQKAIENEFGSFAAWETDFKATGALRGIGWAILYRDATGALINAWIDQHDCGHLIGCSPLLVLDVFEHAFLPDYGLERGEYIDAFMNNVDWEIISERHDKLVLANSFAGFAVATSVAGL